MMQTIEKTIQALERNRIQAVYAETKEQVCQLVKGMLFHGAVITAGGSQSLKESGVWELINDSQYRFYNRLKPGITPEEQLEVFRMAIGCDFFFCSANAVTQNGELINVDGNGNRLSSICFGPKKVIMVIGINKIVQNIEEGFVRIKQVAAPKNGVRLHTATPCEKLGKCVSLCHDCQPDITAGCFAENRMCCHYLISGWQRNKDRIQVIFCGESLGY